MARFHIMESLLLGHNISKVKCHMAHLSYFCSHFTGDDVPPLYVDRSPPAADYSSYPVPQHGTLVPRWGHHTGHALASSSLDWKTILQIQVSKPNSHVVETQKS